MVELAIVIVTYQTRELLRKCLDSLRMERDALSGVWKIIVVDNASTDGTVDMLKKDFPDVDVITNSDNLGPARAFNQGVAEAMKVSDLIIVMNSDVIALPGTIREMISFMEENPDVDGVSCPLFYPDMTPQKTRTHIMRLLPVKKNRPFREDFVGTTFAMIRSRAFHKVGGYDEHYYFYNEDLDWAERARRAGCNFFHLPEIGVIHALGQGRKQNIPKIIGELYKSNIYYYKRHYPNLARIALLALRFEIWFRIRALRKELAAASDERRASEIRSALEVYTRARAKMEEEYIKPCEPEIPEFAYDGA